ncbi:hypothetical protein V494_06419 [Pseudogymnoascus sp. VKM F-4513 (FW-928)]|nr:hypothetical protein V494_06419 [Pseudogymnoascus sp. VKM F-4513 (FW-928)]
MINKAPQDNSNTASVMKQPADLEVFRFLDLPRELRDKIYGNLLIHDKPIQLKQSKLFEIGKRCRYYETRLGLAPQICRANKKVALESLAVLYGGNTFHSTGDNSFQSLYYNLGLNMYSHLVKSIQIDVFIPGFTLSMQSKDWVFCDRFIQFFDNLKKLRFNLPQGLEILTEENKDTLLEVKRRVPKCAMVEFCGANPDIVLELMTAWYKHVPKEKVYPKRVPQPFNPLEWSKRVAREQILDESQHMLSPPASAGYARPATLKRPLRKGAAAKNPCYKILALILHVGYSNEELQVGKKQKLDGKTPRRDLVPMSDSMGKIGKDELKNSTEG